MTENEIIGATVGIAGIFLTVVGMAVKFSRSVSNSEIEIRSDMDAQVDNLQRDIARLERASVERAEVIRHETGEMGAALRAKIHEFETWSRDEFVRKSSFEQVVGRLESSIEKMTDRLEKKFDKAVESFHRRSE